MEIGSAEWYHKHWPKFYNEACYRVLEDFSNNPEKYRSQDDGVEETKQTDPSLENKNLKRKASEELVAS
jgi:hypothetical protein